MYFVNTKDFYFTVVDFLQQNWALIEVSDTRGETELITVHFIDDASRIFDRISFPTIEEAEKGLIRNGFSRFADDTEAQEFISQPDPPFEEGEHPSGKIYSSGEYWI
jgi:hypothetical protein